MARPQKEGMDYFPHDVHASSDQKIEPLLFLYGGTGYAFYFLHLEYVYRESDFAFDISDAETRQILCSKLKVTEQEYEKILNTCLKHGCFDREFYDETGKITSDGIKKRAETVIKKREAVRQKYEKKQDFISSVETIEETKEETQKKPDKVKERKGKERKENITTTPPPTAREGVASFQMTENWRPSEFFSTLAQTSGLVPPEGKALESALHEFIPFWLTQNRQCTAHEWDLAFIKAIKNGFTKSRHGPKETAGMRMTPRQKYMHDLGNHLEAIDNGTTIGGSAAGTLEASEPLPGGRIQREDTYLLGG